MRFKLGLTIGFAAGYWYGSLPEDERKKQLDEALTKVRGNPRLQRVTDTVARNATKVTRAALQNAASIAGLVLTTESLVADKPEPPSAAPAGGGDPMGGMGGMGMM